MPTSVTTARATDALDAATQPTERTVPAFTRAFVENLRNLRGVERYATANDHYQALGYTVRQYLMHDWLTSVHDRLDRQAKSVAYLSAEYLPGRQLTNNLLNGDLRELAAGAMKALDLDLDELIAQEVEPGLGNGGLGRLAACYMDSLATLGLPGVGYGIRYEYGIFEQAFVDGWQVEQADTWLSLGNPWEIPHPDLAVTVCFGGRTEPYTDEAGQYRVRWVPDSCLRGVPYNVIVPGYRNGRAVTLRLWSARATQDFNLRIFNSGDYVQAVAQQTAAENITKVLYPDDTTPQGRRLRLEQQYFFVACSMADAFRFLPADLDLRHLPDHIVFQLNDTHPTIAIAELMRMLIDERLLPWDDAWAIVERCFAFTSHTLLPEAMEQWPVALLAELLPRHLEIINEIDRRFRADVRLRFPGDEGRARRMAIVSDGTPPMVRMAYLATVGSFSVNGVAPLQSRLLREENLRDFAEMWPDRFTNVTNGVTPRRFLALSNPRLTQLISETIGAGWLTDLERLRELEEHVSDAPFRAAWRAAKEENKRDLAAILLDRTGVVADPESLFDVMAKRIHEYKRQLLNVLHVITSMNRIHADLAADAVPRTIIFGGKAAPGYWMAKLIVKLINDVAETIDRDARMAGRLRVIYPPNFNVTLAEPIYAAADLSEQISLAGMEASGTGNMKFALNGAVIIGTLDGANIDIRDRVGPENFIQFGMSVDEVDVLRTGGYDPRRFYDALPDLRQAIDQIGSGYFSPGERGIYDPIVENLLTNDRFMVLADYQSYIEAQETTDAARADTERWTTMSILNAARCGYFSSDRSVRDYQDNIWKLTPTSKAKARKRGKGTTS